MKLELILQIIISLIAVYLAFFKSYLTEKGKSAALKEDLEDLTREVESVKNEFVKEQEMMKTDFQRMLNYDISYRDEERNAIINFHGVINQWWYSILEVSLSDYNRNNISDLIQIRNTNNSFYAKAGIAKSKVILLVEDSILTKSTGDLYLAVMKFHYWADEIFLKYQHNCERHKSLIDGFIMLQNINDENKNLAKSMINDEKELEAERKDIYQNYIQNRNQELENIHPFQNSFETLAKKYLKN